MAEEENETINEWLNYNIICRAALEEPVCLLNTRLSQFGMPTQELKETIKCSNESPLLFFVSCISRADPVRPAFTG